MTPPAVRDAIAAHLTDELDLAPQRAALAAARLCDELALDGWQITQPATSTARPVAPRARGPRARRLSVVLSSRRARMSGEQTR